MKGEASLFTVGCVNRNGGSGKRRISEEFLGETQRKGKDEGFGP